MAELWWQFLSAVWNSWIGRVGAMLTLLAVLEQIPAIRRFLHEKPIIERWVPALWIIALVCMLWGFFDAWNDQRIAAANAEEKLVKLTKPMFQVDIGQCISFYALEQNATIWLPIITVINRQAPSAIVGWKIHYKSSTLDQDVQKINFGRVLTIPIPNGRPIEIDSANLIDVKRGSIQTGDYRDGRLAAQIPGNRTHEIESGTATISVTVFDYLGQEYTGLFNGKREQGIQLVPGEKVIFDKASRNTN